MRETYHESKPGDVALSLHSPNAPVCTAWVGMDDAWLVQDVIFDMMLYCTSNNLQLKSVVSAPMQPVVKNSLSDAEPDPKASCNLGCTDIRKLGTSTVKKHQINRLP